MSLYFSIKLKESTHWKHINFWWTCLCVISTQRLAPFETKHTCKQHCCKILASSKYLQNMLWNCLVLTRHKMLKISDCWFWDLKPQLKHAAVRCILDTNKHENWPKHFARQTQTASQIKLGQAPAISSQCQRTPQTPRLLKALAFTLRERKNWFQHWSAN